MKRVVAVGTVGKDEHVKIDSVRMLPEPFQKFLRKTVPLSRIEELYGEGWTPKRAFDALKRRAVGPVSYSYGGRAPHVAYGIALLGGPVTLVTSFGEDYDEPYPGFFGGGYVSHLKRAGVEMSETRLSLPEDKWRDGSAPRYLRANYGDALARSSAVVVEGKVTSTITCVKDLDGIDFFYLDDVNGAATIERWRPVPSEVVKSSDIVFVTSSEMEFMKGAVDQAYQYGKTVVVDVASYGVTPEYLRHVTPRSTAILGNESEVRQVLDAFEIKRVEELFDVHEAFPAFVAVEDKFAGTVDLYSRKEKARRRIGPVGIRKTGSSTGVCDAIAVGILAALQRDLTIVEGAAAGLVEGSSVWQVEGVQEGLLGRDEFVKRFEAEFGPSLGGDAAERIRKSFR
ncbi:MAG: carbohydrate kinase family protein [Candidatus Brockarchaeota archaeon]|nr:carbohydrate kinase family protein [Candidatus Brockarchaeota archaeon]